MIILSIILGFKVDYYPPLFKVSKIIAEKDSFIIFLVKFASVFSLKFKKSEINASYYHITGNIITFAVDSLCRSQIFRLSRWSSCSGTPPTKQQ